MRKLVLVNGPPGVGKSTLARRYAADHPLTLAVEIDVVRAMIGAWLDERGDGDLPFRDFCIERTDEELVSIAHGGETA